MKRVAFVAIQTMTAAILVLGIGSGPATATAGDIQVTSDCLGLDCLEYGSVNYVPEARDPAPSVSSPTQLSKQTTAGFYEYGHGTSADTRAIAYVVPQNQANRMPASIEALPVTQSLLKGRDFELGSVVIFGPEASLSTMTNGARAAGRRNLRASGSPKRRARMAAQDAYGCEDNYFCLYDCVLFDCAKVQFGPFYTGTGWHRLGDFAFNDRASSMRNRRDRDSLLARDWPAGDSTRYCADSHSSDTTFGNNAIGGDEASSFANVPDDIHC